MFLEEALKRPAIDLLVHGEGEIIFANSFDVSKKGKPLNEVEGISFKKDCKIISPGKEGYVTDVEDYRESL
jgi:hypothetical protein